jgi:glycosyltransferase involved in cell wall biosynthesis
MTGKSKENERMPPDKPLDAPPAASHPRVVFFVNGIYTKHIAGSDIYLTHMARAAIEANYPIQFFGGHALRWFLERQGLPLNQTVTDSKVADLGDAGSIGGQLGLLIDNTRRFFGALRRLKEVGRRSIAVAISDFWWDTLPLILCRARGKILYLGMKAPSLRQVLFRTRADVPASRFGSLHFWFSQQLSLRCLRFCRGGSVIYGHPEIKDYLLRFGYRESQLVYVGNGIDVSAAQSVPDQPKQFDVAWTGRVHPQKGIEDLLVTLKWLKDQLPDFRAVIIGKSKDALEKPVRELGLAANVTFSGLVLEEEKFRLLKASRVFVMPSHYESWGLVVGEAVAAGIAVVAYRLQCYPPLFGDFIRYVNPFDVDEFKRLAEKELRNQRAGQSYLACMDRQRLIGSLGWETSQRAFCKLLFNLEKSLLEPF